MAFTIWRVLAVLALVALQLTIGNGVAISTTKLDSAIRDMQWVGPSDKIIISITESGHVWRSVDGGKSWTDQFKDGKLVGAANPQTSIGYYTPPVGVLAMEIPAGAPNKVFLMGTTSNHWVSTDYGDTYSSIKGPDGHIGFVQMRFHPTESDWLLVIARRWACFSKDPNARSQCADDLFVTQDFGQSWTNLTTKAQGRVLSFVDFDWGWSKDPTRLPKQNAVKKTILATVYENSAEVRKHLQFVAENGPTAGWDKYVDFVVSRDLFDTPHTKTVPCGNQFETVNDIIFLAVAAHCSERYSSDSTTVQLQISSDSGSTFNDACFPMPLDEKGYSVVAVTPNSAYINVDYAEGSHMSPFGSVLSSDSTFTFYTLSLERNARSIFGAVDFTAVSGIPGILIANQFEAKLTGMDVHRQGTAGTVEEGEDSIQFRKSTTVITFDGGDEWFPIPAPSSDSAKNLIHCRVEEGCSLHLHGTSSWAAGIGFAFVYSHPSTPGFVISTGNVGRYLFEDSSVNTYLSRDGGQSWEEIAKGAYIYEFGDSGGVVVMAQHGLHGTTSEVKYTLDEGLSWRTIKLPQPVDVYNIRVEPDNMGRKFVIQGLSAGDESSGNSARSGVVVTVDFEELSDFKECSASDYESWSPSETHCLLGKKMVYKRQKRMAECWNGLTYRTPPPMTSNCQCTLDDYQCDFGYKRPLGTTTRNAPCEPIEKASNYKCPAIASGRYRLSHTKQRLIAGDTCQGQVMQVGRFSSGGYFSFHFGFPHFGLFRFLWWLVIGGVAMSVLYVGYLAYAGQVPSEWLPGWSWLDRLRYRNLRGNFESLAQDLGVTQGDDDYEEMYRRP